MLLGFLACCAARSSLFNPSAVALGCVGSPILSAVSGMPSTGILRLM